MTHKDVLDELLTLANPEMAEHSYRFFQAYKGGYGEGDKFLGIRVPPQRKVAKKFKNMNLNEVELLLQNEFHEARLTALLIMVYRTEKASPEELEDLFILYMNNLKYINNWDLIDSSAQFVVAMYLEDKDRSVLYDLAQSDDLWEKRVAMITCHHYIAKRHDFKDALLIAEILLHDTHDLIHKAVGWMLREIGNVDLDTELEFLNKYYKEMPRTMLRYAIEKFDEPLRLQYLKGEI